MEFNYLKRDENYLLESNKIAYYYKNVFNLEIINLFCKKNLNKFNKDLVEFNNCIKPTQLEVFDFYILIKDNNKKIFKYKILKAIYNVAEYRYNNDKENINFLYKIWYFVDKKVCEYCINNYVNKHNGKVINDIIKKNNLINEDYTKWIIENYSNNSND